MKVCFHELHSPRRPPAGAVPGCLHSHWHSVVELLHSLVVDGDGHLRVGVEGELHVVAGSALCLVLVARQLQILAAP